MQTTFHIEILEGAGQWVIIHISSTYQVCVSWYKRFVSEYPSSKIRIREV